MIQSQYNSSSIKPSMLTRSETSLTKPAPRFGNTMAIVPSGPFSESNRGTTDIRTLLNDMITAFSLWIKQGLEDLVETVLDKVQDTIDKMLPEGMRSSSSPQRKELEQSAKLLGIKLPPIVMPDEKFYRDTVRPAWIEKIRPYMSGDAQKQDDQKTRDINTAHDTLEKAFNPNK